MVPESRADGMIPENVMQSLEMGRNTHISDAGESHQVADHGDRYTES
jgi:hypothetical protein